jgi:serine/threonine protein kinase
MKICPQCSKSYDDIAKICPHDGKQLLEIHPLHDDPLIGQTLADRFLILKVLGEGGMGKVYKALHKHMERICALKLLSSQSTNKEAEVIRFKREAQMAGKINNPHAVAIYDFGEAEAGLFYLAMEYIEGESLKQVMVKESPMSLARVVNIVTQIAEGLTAAHSLGIAHRDVKPENIMLARNGQHKDYVKVLDFGIAKAFMEDAGEALTRVGMVIGTVPYMSPEQVSGKKVDARSDLYSLALIVYEMLCGRLPFAADTMQALAFQRVTHNPVPLRSINPSISPAIESVVMSGLVRECEARIQDVKSFAAALREAAQLNQVLNQSGTYNLSADLTLPTPQAEAAYPPQPQYLIETIVDHKAKPDPAIIQANNHGQIRQNGRKKLYAFWAGLSLLLVAALVIGAIRMDRLYLSTPAPEIANNNQANSDDNEKKSKEHNVQGKRYQESARALANDGLREQAVQENLKAIAEFRQSIDLKEGIPEVHENLALALSDDCNYTDALKEFSKAKEQFAQLKQSPTSQFCINYGMALFDRGLYREAASEFEQALSLNQSDTELYAYIGFAWQNAEQVKRAGEAYEKYLDKDSKGKFVPIVQAIRAKKSKAPRVSGNGCFKTP